MLYEVLFLSVNKNLQAKLLSIQTEVVKIKIFIVKHFYFTENCNKLKFISYCLYYKSLLLYLHKQLKI